MVAFENSGLFGNGKALELRQLCQFAGASAQPVAISLVHSAALRAVAGTVAGDNRPE